MRPALPSSALRYWRCSRCAPPHLHGLASPQPDLATLHGAWQCARCVKRGRKDPHEGAPRVATARVLRARHCMRASMATVLIQQAWDAVTWNAAKCQLHSRSSSRAQVVLRTLSYDLGPGRRAWQLPEAARAAQVEAHGDADLCGHALSLCTVALASPEAAGQRPLRQRFLERLLEAGVLPARWLRPPPGSPVAGRACSCEGWCTWLRLTISLLAMLLPLAAGVGLRCGADVSEQVRRTHTVMDHHDHVMLDPSRPGRPM